MAINNSGLQLHAVLVRNHQSVDLLLQDLLQIAGYFESLVPT